MEIKLSGGIIGLEPEQFAPLIERFATAGISLELIPQCGSGQVVDFFIASPALSDSGIPENSQSIPYITYAPSGSAAADAQAITSEDELFGFLRGLAFARPSQATSNHLKLLLEIVENSPNIVSYSDRDFHVQYLNKTGMERFGYQSIDEIKGSSAFIVRSNDPDDPELKMLLQYLRRYGSWRGEKFLTDVHGNHFPAEMIIQYHHNPTGEDFYSLVARDISHQKARDREIIELQTLYETLAEASQEMIVIISDQGKFLYANNAYKAAFSLNSHDLEGLNVFEGSKKYAPSVAEAMQKVFRTLKTDYVEDIVRLETRNYWLGTWLVPIPDHENQVHSILLVSRDITRDKESELNLIQSLDKEREFNELQSRFVSMISHEFKTPLSTILSSMELLKDYHDKLTPEKKDTLANKIFESVGLMNRLLEDIILIGRIKDQQLRVAPEWIDPVKFSSELMETVLWNDHFGHPIKFSATGPCVRARVDPELLRHILDNLLSNAIKYSALGSKILFNLDCSPGVLKFEIIDEGIGMSVETQEHIFDPFYRGDNCSGIPGTGLGMTVVQKALDMCQGKIEIQSENGKGTRVSIEIPVETGV